MLGAKVLLGIVGVVFVWYGWGFLIQWINYRRGFRDDWFLWGFISVFVPPVAALFSLTTPDDGLVGVLAAIVTLVCIFAPVIVLLVALLRPRGKNK